MAQNPALCIMTFNLPVECLHEIPAAEHALVSHVGLPPAPKGRYRLPSPQAPSESAALQFGSSALAAPGGHKRLVGSAGGSRTPREAPQDFAGREPRARKVPEKSAMPCPGVARKRAEVFHDSGAKRVEVEIADEFQEVDFLVDHDGFVPILQEVTGPPVAAVKLASVASEERSHVAAERARLGSHQKVDMVGQDCEGVDGEVPGPRESGNSPDEIVPIPVIAKDDLAVQSPDHHMVQGSGSVKARSPWHSSSRLA